jgi:Galactose-3-O-sulfotransferase
MGEGRPAAARCIIFVHIPKTAGITLHRALRWKYPSRTIQLDSLRTPLKELAEELPPEARRDLRVVSGHHHYGFHEHVPHECAYITLVREPVARVVSMYHFILGNPKHWLHDELVRSGMGLEEFVRTAADPGVDNQQTRLISGLGSGEIGPWQKPPPLDRGALELARRNLEKFLVVGLTERFDESFILIRRALRWRLPMYVTTNRTSVPKSASQSAIDAIRERNQLDLELYDFGRELFATAVAEQGGSLRRELAAFRTLNRIPNRIGDRVPLALRRRLKQALPR